MRSGDPMPQRDIVTDPQRRFGAPCVAGTRLDTDLVAGYYWAAGLEGVLNAYDHLTRDGVLIACWWTARYGAAYYLAGRTLTTVLRMTHSGGGPRHLSGVRSGVQPRPCPCPCSCRFEIRADLPYQRCRSCRAGRHRTVAA